MRKKVAISSLAAVAALVVVGLAAWSAYRALQRVPEFYDTALALEPGEQASARDAFVAQATALAGDLHSDGRWQSLFTAEQINAWLALELAQNYPGLLPDELHDPRISLEADGATIGCRYTSGDLEAVLSLSFQAYLHAPNVLALRIRHARAGALPVPLAQVLDNISYAARQLNLRLEWRKSHGDPVALITLPQSSDGTSEAFCLDALEVREGELYVSGTTGRRDPNASPIVAEPLRVPTARLQPSGGDQPRLGSAATETRQN